jgi:hypothetical protein
MTWLTKRLIDDWKRCWRFASVWLAAVAGALSAVIVANPGLALGLLPYLPTGFWRGVVAVAIGMVVFVVPTITRLWQQSSTGSSGGASGRADPKG